MAQGQRSDGGVDRKKCPRVAIAQRRKSKSPRLHPHAVAHLKENSPALAGALWYPTKAWYPRSSEPSKRSACLWSLAARRQATCPREFRMSHYHSTAPIGYLL